MLVLTRKVGEALVLGDGEVIVRVVGISSGGSKVRIGIEAPDELPVHRQEVYEAIRRDQQP